MNPRSEDKVSQSNSEQNDSQSKSDKPQVASSAAPKELEKTPSFMRKGFIKNQALKLGRTTTAQIRPSKFGNPKAPVASSNATSQTQSTGSKISIIQTPVAPNNKKVQSAQNDDAMAARLARKAEVDIDESDTTTKETQKSKKRPLVAKSTPYTELNPILLNRLKGHLLAAQNNGYKLQFGNGATRTLFNLQYRNLLSFANYCEHQFSSGRQAQAVFAMPTGTGKTFVFLSYLAMLMTDVEKDKAQQLKDEPRILIVVSRTALLKQTASELEVMAPHLKVARYDGTHKDMNEIDRADIVITTYQSLQKSSKEFFPEGAPTFYSVIFDEAHACTSDKMATIINRIKGYTNLLYFTATPEWNLKLKGYSTVYEVAGFKQDGSNNPIPRTTLVEAIEQGILAPVKTGIIDISISQEKIDQNRTEVRALRAKKLEKQSSSIDSTSTHASQKASASKKTRGRPKKSANEHSERHFSDEDQLISRVINSPEFNMAAVKAYCQTQDQDNQQYLFGKQGFINCSGIAHADDMAKLFNDNFIIDQHIQLSDARDAFYQTMRKHHEEKQRLIEKNKHTSDQKKAFYAKNFDTIVAAIERNEVPSNEQKLYYKYRFELAAAIHSNHKSANAAIKKFRRGGILIAIGNKMLTEGVDVPKAAFIMDFSASRSDVTFVQFMGRGLRAYPNKIATIIVVNFDKIANQVFPHMFLDGKTKLGNTRHIDPILKLQASQQPQPHLNEALKEKLKEASPVIWNAIPLTVENNMSKKERERKQKLVRELSQQLGEMMQELTGMVNDLHGDTEEEHKSKKNKKTESVRRNNQSRKLATNANFKFEMENGQTTAAFLKHAENLYRKAEKTIKSLNDETDTQTDQAQAMETSERRQSTARASEAMEDHQLTKVDTHAKEILYLNKQLNNLENAISHLRAVENLINEQLLKADNDSLQGTHDELIIAELNEMTQLISENGLIEKLESLKNIFIPDEVPIQQGRANAPVEIPMQPAAVTQPEPQTNSMEDVTATTDTTEEQGDYTAWIEALIAPGEEPSVQPDASQFDTQTNSVVDITTTTNTVAEPDYTDWIEMMIAPTNTLQASLANQNLFTPKPSDPYANLRNDPSMLPFKNPYWFDQHLFLRYETNSLAMQAANKPPLCFGNVKGSYNFLIVPLNDAQSVAHVYKRIGIARELYPDFKEANHETMSTKVLGEIVAILNQKHFLKDKEYKIMSERAKALYLDRLDRESKASQMPPNPSEKALLSNQNLLTPNPSNPPARVKQPKPNFAHLISHYDFGNCLFIRYDTAEHAMAHIKEAIPYGGSTVNNYAFVDKSNSLSATHLLKYIAAAKQVNPNFTYGHLGAMNHEVLEELIGALKKAPYIPGQATLLKSAKFIYDTLERPTNTTSSQNPPNQQIKKP